MAKVDRQKLIQYFRDHLGTPYAETDCSGGFVKAFEEQGASIYHGSNRIIRVHVHDLRHVSSLDEILPGEAVFKIRDDVSGMKAEYKPGGAYYNANIPWDAYHIGLRAPEGILHFTDPVSKLDTDIGKQPSGWDMAAKLDDVGYDDVTEEGGTVVATVMATVTSLDGNPVRMRNSPSKDERNWVYVDNGTRVIVLEKGNTWSKIKPVNGNRQGYMMSEFLKLDDAAGTPETGGTNGTSLEGRVEALERSMQDVKAKLQTLGL